MDLATQQRKLLGLFRTSYRPTADDDAYIWQVAGSKDLEEGRRNIFLWRTWVLERTCALTVRLLRRRNLFDVTLRAFMRETNISPFRETQAPAFLETLRGHQDPMVRSVAQFELALGKVRDGDEATYTIPFTVDPLVVLNRLANDMPLHEHPAEGLYGVVVSRKLKGYFRVLADEKEGKEAALPRRE
jgi:hypothetical protein